MCLFISGCQSDAYHFGSLWPWHWLLASFLGFSCLKHISYITANFPQMCHMLDQFLWGHSSRVCDISCWVDAFTFQPIKWAPTRENLSSGFPTKWDSNQPAQLKRLARKLKFRLYQARIWYFTISEKQGRWSDCAYAQAGLRLCCSQTTEGRFSRGEAQIISYRDVFFRPSRFYQYILED